MIEFKVCIDFYRTEKSNDDVVLEVANDILKLLPVSIEDFTDTKDSHTGPIQNIPRPSLKDILFKEAPELKDKEKEKSKAAMFV
jgi:hypothetical protein